MVTKNHLRVKEPMTLCVVVPGEVTVTRLCTPHNVFLAA